ncbi:hypothetical protein R3P38DRAFT_2797525 [Favolaschia claudopus]|uniref:F-box domain-containing protein n=1 Tax=Favolaschia claudopus TaxID=2862362 RepID=A0AAW0A3Y6_9AGAR
MNTNDDADTANNKDITLCRNRRHHSYNRDSSIKPKQIADSTPLASTTVAEQNRTKGICSLPTELMVEIFTQCASQECPSSRRFMFMRCRISRVCRHWHAIIHSLESFWTVVPLSICSTVTSIGHFLDTNVTGTFAVAIYSGDTSLQNFSRGKLGGERLMRLLMDHSHRWHTLEIVAVHRSFVLQVVQLLDSVSIPNLRSITFHCNDTIDAAVIPITSVLGSRTHQLETLELTRLSVGRLLSVEMPRLKELVLADIAFAAWPTLADMCNLLRFSPLMERLELRGIGFAFPTSFQFILDVPLRMTRMRKLAISFDNSIAISSQSIYAFLICVSFPTLSTLHLRFATNDDMQGFAARNLALCAPNVEFSGMFSDTNAIRSMLSRMDQVVQLDVTSCILPDLLGVLADSFRTPMGSLDLYMPKLTRLIVSSRFWSVIHSVLVGRLSRGFMLPELVVVKDTDLTASHYLPTETLAYTHELTSMVSNLYWSRRKRVRPTHPAVYILA